ncbi:hypothetical protein RFI_40386, partial [Reticulomyxa filosa]
MNEQFNPKYSTMIPFMAGMLYDNIENGKDRSGSGLLYFWKLLHSSPPQLTPINQMMLFVHCLDACKADTESSFLSSKLKCCHKRIISLFKLYLIFWITFSKAKGDRCQLMHRPFDNVLKLYLPKLRYVLVHPDIHSCIVKQLNKCHPQLEEKDEEKLKDQLEVLKYLCVSITTSKT